MIMLVRFDKRDSPSSKRTKNIDVRYHFTRDLVNRGKMVVEHVDTERQRADFLTKPFTIDKFSEHRDVLNVVHLTWDWILV